MSPEVYIIIAVLAIPCFFFWRWVFRKKSGKTSKNLWVTLLTVLTAPLLYTVIVLLWILAIEYYPNRDFTVKEWKANPDTRYEYTHDLIKRKLLIGKTKAQVAGMLGDNSNTDDDWYYDIGYLPEITGIDPSSIVITFRNGKVVEVVEHDR